MSVIYLPVFLLPSPHPTPPHPIKTSIQSKALNTLSLIQHHQSLAVRSAALSRWRRRVLAETLAKAAVRRLANMSRRRELQEVMRRWRRRVEVVRAVERLAGKVERTARGVLLARGLKKW